MCVCNRAGLTAGAVIATVLLAGCGASNGRLLSSAAATQLTSELNQASGALAAYNCLPAQTALTNFKDDVGQLTGVNATLVQTLSQAASKITALANQRCPTGASSQTTTTGTTPTTSTTSTTSTSVPATTPLSTVTSQTDTDSGGAAPTTGTTPEVTTPPVVTAPTTNPVSSATTPDSGGAGLGSSGTTVPGDGGTP